MEKIILLKNPNEIQLVAKSLCNIDPENMLNILQNLFTNGDLSGLMKTVKIFVDFKSNLFTFRIIFRLEMPHQTLQIIIFLMTFQN